MFALFFAFSREIGMFYNSCEEKNLVYLKCVEEKGIFRQGWPSPLSAGSGGFLRGCASF